MEPRKFYYINEKRFVFSLTLEQDELLAPIVRRMLEECPDALTTATRSLLEVARETVADPASRKPERTADEIRRSQEDHMLSMTLDLVKVNAWIYEKRLAREILAIVLVPEGGSFNEADLPERQLFMAHHATRDVASEVINHFFMRSGVFGVASATSSEKGPETPTAQ